MPPLPQCAASAPLNGILDQDEYRSWRKTGKIRPNLGRCRPLLEKKLSQQQLEYQIKTQNPLLERFVAELPDLVSVPCLRKDSQPLRRVGQPLSNPSSSAEPSDEVTNPYRVIKSKLIFAELPGLTSANFKWASSAIRRMKFEAIYI